MASNKEAIKKSLLAISVGVVGFTSGLVDKIIRKFGLKLFSVILFHYDSTDYSRYAWYSSVTHVTALKQMKWWYIRRFVTPSVAKDYEYLFLWDEDTDVEHFAPLPYVKLARHLNLALSMPAYLRQPNQNSTMWPLLYRPSNYKNSSGRFTNFVECSVPVFSTKVWSCIWSTLQNDLSSGWGSDLIWYKACEDLLQRRTGVVDAYPIIHRSSKSGSNFTNFTARATKEQLALYSRFPGYNQRPKAFSYFG